MSESILIPERLPLICPDARLTESWGNRPSYCEELRKCFEKDIKAFGEKFAIILLDDKHEGGEYGTNEGMALRAHFFTEGNHDDGVGISARTTMGRQPRKNPVHRKDEEPVHGKDYVLVAAGFYVHLPDHSVTTFDSSSCWSTFGYSSPDHDIFPLDPAQLSRSLKVNYPETRSSTLNELLQETLRLEVIKAFNPQFRPILRK